MQAAQGSLVRLGQFRVNPDSTNRHELLLVFVCIAGSFWLPAVVTNAQWTSVIEVPGSDTGYSGPGTQVNFRQGAWVGYHLAIGSELNFYSGSRAESIELLEGSKLNLVAGAHINLLSARDSTVSIQGGTVNFLGGTYGGEVSMTGGTVVSAAHVGNQTGFTLQGGTILSRLSVGREGRADISGGIVHNFQVQSNSIANVSGGGFRDRFRAETGSEVNLYGGEFLIDGIPLSDGTSVFDVSAIANVSGTLEDGSVFALSKNAANALDGLNLITTEVPSLVTTEILISDLDAPKGLRPSQSLTLVENGRLQDYFTAASATLTVEGGSIGSYLKIANTSMHVSGGRIGENFVAEAGSSVSIKGGVFGRQFNHSSDSEVKIIGEDFRLNGVPITSPPNSLTRTDVLTATLQNGTTLLLSGLARDRLDGVALVPVALPAPDLTPMRVADDSNLTGLRRGQTIELAEGGALEKDFAAVGANLRIEGGTIDHQLEIANTQVAISNGSIGNRFYAFDQSTIDVAGGTIGDDFVAYGASSVNVTGGELGDRFIIGDQSIVVISGGRIGDNFTVQESGKARISGGAIGTGFSAGGDEVVISGGTFGRHFKAGPNVKLIGSQFVVNGVALSPANSNGTHSGTISGVLQDGSPFIFSHQASDYVEEVLLVHSGIPEVSYAPQVINAESSLLGLQQGQTLTLTEGGTLGENFVAVGGTLNVAGGVVDWYLEAANTVVNLTDGSIAPVFEVYSGSEVNISGGTVGGAMSAYSGSVVNISGGVVESDLRAHRGSLVNISRAVRLAPSLTCVAEKSIFRVDRLAKASTSIAA